MNEEESVVQELFTLAMGMVEGETGKTSAQDQPPASESQPSSPTLPQPSSTQAGPSPPTQTQPSPTQSEPSSPTMPKPSSPTQPEPSSPTQPEPSSPTLPEPSSPTLPEPSSPSQSEPSPTQPELSSPTQPEPSSPTQPEPSSPTQPEPSSPILTQSSPSALPQPSSPTLGDMETALIVATAASSSPPPSSPSPSPAEEEETTTTTQAGRDGVCSSVALPPQVPTDAQCELTVMNSDEWVLPCQSLSTKGLADDGGGDDDNVNEGTEEKTGGSSGGERMEEEEVRREMPEEEEEKCQLLDKFEMDHYTLHPMDGSSSGTGEGGQEERGLVEKPVERPVRTCAVLCVAFFFVYTANLAIQNLQSSLHQAAGLGVTSLAVLYGSIIVFGTLSPLVIRFLTAKRTLVLAFVCHLLYTLSNLYSTFPTLLTSSLLLGAMAGPMWTAQGLYCTATGLAYAGIKQMETHGALSLFNGIFFAFYEATQISGNLIASLVLQRDSYNDSAIVEKNQVCGAALCPGVTLNSTMIEQPEQHIVYILMSIYLACNIAGLLLTIFALPPLPRGQEVQAAESSIKKSTTSCLSMLLVPKMLLLLPFFMAQAMNSGILLAEYNEKFVSCSVGIQWVGYVMTVFGVVTSVQAVGLNCAAKLLGRRILFSAAAIADLSVNVVMLQWDPAGTHIGYLFILPCLSGFAEGIFQAQFNSLVAMVFPDHVTGAFATYHTSKATAFTLTFILARFLCLNERLYVSLTLSALGLIGYCIVEVMLHRAKSKTVDDDGDPKLVKVTPQGNKQT